MNRGRILLFSFLLLAITGAAGFPQEKSAEQVPPGCCQERPVASDAAAGMGSREFSGKDGAKDKIYYSVTTPEEEEKAGREEKEKLERSWDALTNTVIDGRRRRR